MSWSALPENPFRRLITVFFGILLGVYTGLISAPLFAQGEFIPRGQPIPETIRYVRNAETGVLTRVSARMSQATMNGSAYHTFNLPVPASRLGQLGKAAIKRGLPGLGWGMVFKDLVNGAGWAIDELRQQVVSTPAQEPEPLGDVAYCKMVGQGVMRCASNPARVVDLYAHDNTNPEYVSWHFRTDRGRNEACALNAGGVRVICYDIVTVVRPTQGWGGYSNGNQGTDAVPVSDADLGNLLKQSPQVINAILVDPDTGAPIRTPELIDALNALRQQLEAANGLEPGPDLLPSDDYSDAVPNETEWPEFCMWADVVCDFIEWWKDDGPPPEKPEVPWDIENPTDLQQSWSSGLGGGSCPSPHQFTVEFMGWSVSPSFTFEPVCGFATMMRPVILSMATIIAVLIVAGIRGTKDA